jgi:TolB-like protein
VQRRLPDGSFGKVIYRSTGNKRVPVCRLKISATIRSPYFMDGIQRGDPHGWLVCRLEVISRTSTQQYQSKARNLREIAKQLGVANIVEGMYAADQIRVNSVG